MVVFCIVRECVILVIVDKLFLFINFFFSNFVSFVLFKFFCCINSVVLVEFRYLLLWVWWLFIVKGYGISNDVMFVVVNLFIVSVLEWYIIKLVYL